jgi:hypothetical protein
MVWQMALWCALCGFLGGSLSGGVVMVFALRKVDVLVDMVADVINAVDPGTGILPVADDAPRMNKIRYGREQPAPYVPPQ